jgi:hypothetical protein
VLRACRFLILVAGTVVYGHGDEQELSSYLKKLEPPQRAALRWQIGAKKALAKRRPIFRVLLFWQHAPEGFVSQIHLSSIVVLSAVCAVSRPVLQSS